MHNALQKLYAYQKIVSLDTQICKNLNKEGACRFKERFAYKHEKEMIQNTNVKDLITNHEKEISALIDEMNQLKQLYPKCKTK